MRIVAQSQQVDFWWFKTTISDKEVKSDGPALELTSDSTYEKSYRA